MAAGAFLASFFSCASIVNAATAAIPTTKILLFKIDASVLKAYHKRPGLTATVRTYGSRSNRRRSGFECQQLLRVAIFGEALDHFGAISEAFVEGLKIELLHGWRHGIPHRLAKAGGVE